MLGKNDFAIVSVQIQLNLIFEIIRFENFKFNFHPLGVTKQSWQEKQRLLIKNFEQVCFYKVLHKTTPEGS